MKKERRLAILTMARKQYENDGEVEIDECAKISEGKHEKGESGGAYVAAWVWVDFAETPLDKAT